MLSGAKQPRAKRILSTTAT